MKREDRVGVQHTGASCLCLVYGVCAPRPDLGLRVPEWLRTVDTSVYEVHFVNLPKFEEPLWYITIGSFNAYNNRRAKEFAELGFSRTSTIKHVADAFGLDQADKVKVHHANLWAFYEHIGYDHRRNTFSVGSVK